MTTKITIGKGIMRRSPDSYRVHISYERDLGFISSSGYEYDYAQLEDHFVLGETNTTRWPNVKEEPRLFGIAHSREEAKTRLLAKARERAIEEAKSDSGTIEERLEE